MVERSQDVDFVDKSLLVLYLPLGDTLNSPVESRLLVLGQENRPACSFPKALGGVHAVVVVDVALVLLDKPSLLD